MEPIRETERELVGAYLRDSDNAAFRETLVDTLDVLTPAAFSDEIAGELFGIVRALTKERNELPTLPAIIDGARSNPVLKALEIHAIIAEWMEAGATTSATIEADRERIKEESERRALAYQLSRGLDELKDPAKNPTAVFQSVVHAVEQEQDKGRETVIKSCSELWYDFLEEVESGKALIRIPTGLESLDKALDGGYRSGTLNIIAARPGGGKSALMLQQARAAARAGFSPLIFSLEMTGCELIERFYRQTIGGNPLFFSPESAAELHSYFNAEFFEVIDAPMDIDEIEAYALRYHRKHPKAVFYVDYLGFIDKSEEEKNIGEVAALDEITKRLKKLAKRTGAPVILLAQLNRDSGKTNEPPKKSQLRGSGGIEQNADTISFLWIPDEEKNTSRQLILAKQRQGPDGMKYGLEFHGERTLFVEAQPEGEDTHKKTKKKKGTPPAPASPPPQPAEGATDFSHLNTGDTGGFEF